MGLFEFFRKRKGAKVKKHNDDMVILVMKEKVAECLFDFLEAEFAQGIGSDPDCKGIKYVENIRSVYKVLKKAVKKMTDNEIKRRDTEIDILIRKNETLKDEVSELQLKNAELQHSCDVVQSVKNQYKDILKTANAKNRDLEEAFTKFVDDGYNIRAEAIKHFAERLKNTQRRRMCDGYVISYIPFDEIDNLVKEMVGDEK